ncbi:MAG: LptA/OstA family protein [Parvibaculaceae bacterium]|nr:LptA/OstA family protein [Parvibaculaceae bacterium]
MILRPYLRPMLAALVTCAVLLPAAMAMAAPVILKADAIKAAADGHTLDLNGRAHATQGALLIRGDNMIVTLAPGAKPDQGRVESGGITGIEASGWVHVMIRDQVTADGQWVRYDPAAHSLTMGDSVTLWQDGATSKGSKLTLDTQTGKADLSGESGSTKGDALPPPWINERAK